MGTPSHLLAPVPVHGERVREHQMYHVPCRARAHMRHAVSALGALGVRDAPHPSKTILASAVSLQARVECRGVGSLSVLESIPRSRV